ncbi:recombinase family protein, partial [Vibrio sp. WJH972]
RTDKLLSLLGFNSKSSDYSVIQNVITNELEQRLSAIETRLLAVENPRPNNRKEKPKPSPKSNVQIQAPELKPVNGVISHKVYKSEMDSFVMKMVVNGHSLQEITVQLNELGWLTQRDKEWTRNAVGAITRRLKDKTLR